jgi:acyl-CoA synthetase (AMP-forming)/AMP-acid ligase II
VFIPIIFLTKTVQTFIDIVQQRASQTPDRVAYRFIKGAGLDAAELRYGELWHLVRQLAAVLQARGLGGQQVLLICKEQRTFVISFFACLAAGIVPVPTALPRRKALIGRLQSLLENADARAILCDASEMEVLAAANAAVAYVDLQALLDEIADGGDAAICCADLPQVPPEGIAFLQYTSGSTGDPKGVVVTHANLMANSAVIREAMDISAASAVFTALPLFHDMGLVGGMLQPMYAGCPGHSMSPAEFVQYPERWLQCISKFGITVSGGPNFMYELAARSVGPALVEACDLSTWKVAFCGAEPIRSATVKLFRERFASLGFQPNAFYPCYGMAEATLFITGHVPGQALALHDGPGGCRVGCGVVYGDTRVLIVDPDTRQPLQDGQVGEIWVRGSSVAQGYWRRPELSSASFHARLADGGPETYLRTGDLGLLLQAELYITSRLKDVIVMYGKKFAPQDLEAEAQASHEALCEQGCAAFSVAGADGESVVLVCELRRAWLRRPEAWPLIARAIAAAVSAAHALKLADIVFIKPTTLPRTSSGKVRRAQCRSDYLDGTLERVDQGDEAALEAMSALTN